MERDDFDCKTAYTPLCLWNWSKHRNGPKYQIKVWIEYNLDPFLQTKYVAKRILC